MRAAGREYLFCFGYDRQRVLRSGKAVNMRQLNTYRKAIAQPLKYNHLLGQRVKVENFRSFVPYAERLYAILPLFRDDILMFWELLTVLLLAPFLQEQVLTELLHGDWLLTPQEYLLFEQTVRAVVPVCEPCSRSFATLVARL